MILHQPLVVQMDRLQHSLGSTLVPPKEKENKLCSFVYRKKLCF